MELNFVNPLVDNGAVVLIIGVNWREKKDEEARTWFTNKGVNVDAKLSSSSVYLIKQIKLMKSLFLCLFEKQI